MKSITMQLSEISESREVMESRPYPMVILFIYILMAILAIALTWMYFGEIDVVLKGAGVIRPNESISVITNKVTGRVGEVFIEEGNTVKRGDVLFVIEHGDLKASEALLNNEITKSEAELVNLKKYRDSVLADKNLFNSENTQENPYYYKFIGFSANRGADSATADKLSKDSKGLRLVRNSILLGASQFTEDTSPYAMKFKEFSLKDEELAGNADDAQKQYETKVTLYNQGAIPKRELDDARISCEKAVNSRKQYKNGFLNTLDTGIESSELQIKKLVTGNISEAKQKNAVGMLSLEAQEIVSTDDKIKQTTTSLSSLQEQQVKAQLEIEKCTLRAEIDGTVNLKQKIAIGDYLGGGTLIANVIPVVGDTYKVQISMPEKEISNVRIGDTVKLQVHALPHQEYGDLMGKVTKLSTDSVFDEKQGINYFVIEADVNNKPLYSYKGKASSLKVGMSCEARVITKSKRILSFLLEKIELWD